MLKKNHPRKKRKNSELLKTIWQTIFFSSFSWFLILFLVNNGWELVNKDQVVIIGNSIFNKESILSASGISFPKPLLKIIPKEIERSLKRELSLKAVSIERHIFPQQLFISVLERKPIAYAQRRTAEKLENGMIDQYAEWIPLRWEDWNQSEIDLIIEGWRASQRKLISYLLINKKSLGSPLKKIILDPNGEISLQTKDFNLIMLGANSNLLRDQIRILSHLNSSISTDLLNKRVLNVDLRDPSKPELQTGQPK